MIVNKFIKFVLFSALTIVLSILVAQFGPTPQQVSAQNANITGWMWSDNVGWVSLTCDNTTSCGTSAYGINQDTDGDWEGYGWSDNIGWIKFDSGCPSGSEGQCGSKMITNTLRGWARFCAGSDDGACGAGPRPDGWDGWVSLSSTNDHNPSVAGVQTSAFAYGPTQSGSQVTGYAWGSTVVGWTQMVDVTVASSSQSTLRLVASASVPTAGALPGMPTDLYSASMSGSAVLSWYVTNSDVTYTSCTGSSATGGNNWNGQTLNVPTVLPPTFEYRENVTYNLNTENPSIFTINCTRSTGGSDSATAQVYNSPDCVVNLSGGGSFCASGPNARIPVLTWTSSNATECNAGWFTGTNATNKPTSGTQEVGAGSYQLTCTTQGSGALCTSGVEVVTQLPANDPQCTNVPECSDSADNDGDGKIDFPDDPECLSPQDDREAGGSGGGGGPIDVIEH